MATTALDQIVADCGTQGLTPQIAERLAAELARMFKVRAGEVGILRVEGKNLVFIHPAKLSKMAKIPLNTIGSVAARAVNSKRAEIINNFSRTRHTSFFEMVDTINASSGQKSGKHPNVIQKLISAPVVASGQAVGVIQVSRKAATPAAAGPDFVAAELQQLVSIAASVAECFR